MALIAFDTLKCAQRLIAAGVPENQAHVQAEVMAEAFVYNMLVNVLNAQDSAPLAVEAILKAQTFDPGPKAQSIDDPAEWTREKIIERGKDLNSDKGPAGDFDD